MARGLAPLAAALVVVAAVVAPAAAAPVAQTTPTPSVGESPTPVPASPAVDPAQLLQETLETVAADGDEADWEDRALAGAITELSGLEDLGALRRDDTVVALVTIVDGRITTVSELQAIDAANARLLEQRPEGDGPIGPEVAAVLAPLTPEELEAARTGDGSIDAAPWVAAIQTLVVEAIEEAEAADDATATEAAADATATETEASPRAGAWLDRIDLSALGDRETVAVVAAAVGVLALVGFVALRLRRRSGRDRFTAAVAHGTAIVLEASRRMTGAVDAEEVRRIALRTALDLGGADTGAWIERGGVEGPRWATATPDAPLGAPHGGAGVIARALQTGQTTSGDAGDEPWIDAGKGQVVAVPVIDDGAVIGAMVVHRAKGEVPATAVHGLTSLAPVTAAALAAATAHRGAIDASLADPLTGLPNRRRLDHDLAAAGRTGRFSVAMVDIDHFKHFNDTNGHAAGDLALQLVARALSGAVRGGDTVYRYGGEEFCVLLPRATDPEVVTRVADRLRSAIHATVVPGGEHQPSGRVTASIGVAVRDEGQHVEEVMFAADAALYRAKQAGRDQAQLAG